MKLVDFSLKNKHAVIAISLLITVLGLRSFFMTPTDLFPKTVPPQVAVVTILPGASAGEVADKITQVIEKELSSLDKLVKIYSTSRDEVSSINLAFLYSKSAEGAVLDVQNVLNRIRADLPAGIQTPRIFQITDETKPLMTIALSPKDGSSRTFPEIRLLAENQIKDAFLSKKEIADVDVFGGYNPEIEITVQPHLLMANDISLIELAAALKKNNVSAPVGVIYGEENEWVIKTNSEFTSLDSIRNLAIRKDGRGYLCVKDIAKVELSSQPKRSIYHGNGKQAIALNVLKPGDGNSISGISASNSLLKKLKLQYPDIEFEVTYDQQPIIDLNVDGMRMSLGQAIVLTVLVIFIFIGRFRAAMIISISIPLTFLFSLIILGFTSYTLNMVTLSGLIIAIGMVVDASIVVLENIFRHREKNPELSRVELARRGTVEVAPAIIGGMLTTVIVLFPVMFSGGYTQQTMRPLNMMISCTLVASLIAALTIIPVLASKWLPKTEHRSKISALLLGWVDPLIDRISAVYLASLKWALKRRFVVVVLVVVFVVLTMRLVAPLNGKELMPPMDTGIAIIAFESPSTYSAQKMEDVLTELEKVIYETQGIVSISSVVGSEPGQISFGGGGATTQSGRITINMVNRKKRTKTIWQIMDGWRLALSTNPDLRSFTITEYGATPVSTTKAPIDIIIAGQDSKVLDKLADDVMKALEGTPALVDLRRSWVFDKVENHIEMDPILSREFNVNPADASSELLAAVKGIPATQMRLKGFLDIPFRLKYEADTINHPDKLLDSYIPTRHGMVPLRALAQINVIKAQPFITRENLKNTIDVTGVNRGQTVSHVTESVAKRIKGLKLPTGYTIEVSGTSADMKKGGAEMGKALLIGIVLLYFLLVLLYKSFLHPVTIMSVLPPAVAGAFWGLLIFDKPMCKPATMGLILLCGTLVNNSILLLEFIQDARKRGVGKDEAIMDAVRLRLRPILMTTVSTIVGLTPLITESAIGLERMSPLAIVAATGLLSGTVITMVVAPVIYSLLDSLQSLFSRQTSKE